jgi:hypothetical protein
MRLGSLSDLHSLNLGTMSARVGREEFMVTDHGIDKQEVAETSRKREAIPIPRGLIMLLTKARSISLSRAVRSRLV